MTFLPSTASSSSRWAGTITRSSEDAYQLTVRNLHAERSSLRVRITAITARLAVPTGQKQGRTRGYASPAERYEKQRRQARAGAGGPANRLPRTLVTGPDR